jgi:hypothetical protein
VTVPLTDGLQLTFWPTSTVVGEQPRELIEGALGPAVVPLDTEMPCCEALHALTLQACSVITFCPVELNDVEKEDPLPVDGDPPEADHERDVTVPLIEGLQLTESPIFTEVGEQPSELIDGAVWPLGVELGRSVCVAPPVPDASSDAVGRGDWPDGVAVAEPDGEGVGVASASTDWIRASRSTAMLEALA